MIVVRAAYLSTFPLVPLIDVISCYYYSCDRGSCCLPEHIPAGTIDRHAVTIVGGMVVIVVRSAFLSTFHLVPLIGVISCYYCRWYSCDRGSCCLPEHISAGTIDRHAVTIVGGIVVIVVRAAYLSTFPLVPLIDMLLLL